MKPSFDGKRSLVCGCGCAIDRRNFLAGAVATAALPLASAIAQTSGPKAEAFRIDVHHHLTPPDYIAGLSGKVRVPQASLEWSIQKTLDDMDAAGVQTAMLSITTPGLWFGDVGASTRLARACNEYTAPLVADNKPRFGSFAAMPMPNVDATLGEIAYAFDTLRADGVSMFTSYDGKWLGDAAFVPVFDELNRRKAIVATHPTTAACCGNLIPYIPDSVVEFGTDTTRTIASPVFSGAADRWPDIKFIFSHAGGSMPFLIERFEVLARAPQAARMMPNGVRNALRRFYYDTAQASNPAAMGALRDLVEPSQIVFGTDFPYRNGFEQTASLSRCGFSASDLKRIERDNALSLLPRLRV